MSIEGPAAVSGAVLAGGRSRRLGRDKRLVKVGGETLLARTVRVLAAVADDVTVVVADPEDRALVTATVAGEVAGHGATGTTDATGVAVAVDARPGPGPVAGLEAALTAAAHPWVLVVATDHPALSVPVLRLLATTARGVVDRAAIALAGPRGPEPLLAAYRREAVGTVTGLLDAGTRRMVDVLAALDPLVVPRDALSAVDPDGAVLRDVDVPGDLPGA
jgi:molybdopterin-guanine dinucleotide biosynthesis protein A